MTVVTVLPAFPGHAGRGCRSCAWRLRPGLARRVRVACAVADGPVRVTGREGGRRSSRVPRRASARPGSARSAAPVCASRSTSGVTRRRPPVLLTHGGFDFARTFEVFAPLLAAAGWRVVAWDQRGHGDSEHAPLYSWDADLRDAVAVIDATTRDPLPVVGHSQGRLAHGAAGGQPASPGEHARQPRRATQPTRLARRRRAPTHQAARQRAQELARPPPPPRRCATQARHASTSWRSGEAA